MDEFDTEEVFDAAFGEQRISSTSVIVICLGDLVDENNDFVGAGFNDCLDGVLGFVTTLDF